MTMRNSSFNRRRFVHASLAAASLGGLAGCTGGGGSGGSGGSGGGGSGGGSGGGGTPTPSQAITVGGVTIPSDVVSGAQMEGECVLIASVDEPDLQDPIKVRFEEDIPGVSLQVSGLGSSEIASKVVSETRSGNVQTDAASFSTSTGRSIEGVDPYVSFENDHWIKQASNDLGYAPGYWREPEARGYELPGYGLPYTLLYNTDKTTESEAPDSWEELGEDQWTGSNGIVMQHPSQLSSIGGLYATLFGIWGEEKWISEVARLADNNPQLISSNSQSYRTMVQGEKALSPNYINDLVAQIDAGEEPPAATKWLDPALQVTVQMHLIKDSPNPAAGLAFAAWWLSERGQQTIGDTGRTPIHGPTASTHDLFKAVIPQGVTIRPEAYNNPTYQGAAYTENQDPWVELFNEHFGA